MYTDGDDETNVNTQWESEIMLKDSRWSMVKGKKKFAY